MLCSRGCSVPCRFTRLSVHLPLSSRLALPTPLLFAVAAPFSSIPLPPLSGRELERLCGRVRKNFFDCVDCSGKHQQLLREHSCEEVQIAAWCRGEEPPGGGPKPIPRRVPCPSCFEGSALIESAVTGDLNGFYHHCGAMAPRGCNVSTPVWKMCYSSLTDEPTPAAFHAACDAHAGTVTVARNSLNHTFGGYAQGSWSADTCCANPHNDCVRKGPNVEETFCYNFLATRSFIFGLAPQTAAFYPLLVHDGKSKNYFMTADPSSWPLFGEFGDLRMGNDGPPGHGA